MPKSPDIRRVLIVGSGPIVIGQACEFDYSGTQACRALREEGVAVVLLNSNPATIMTDPEMAERTYLEPITPETIDQILALETSRGTPVDSLLPTLGGQTGLNCAMAAAEAGILERHRVQLIGASAETIRRAEDRASFKQTVQSVGIDVPRSETAQSLDEALAVRERIGLPACIRPAYTLGGAGGGLARTPAEFEYLVRDGLSQSRIGQVLIEEDLTGWKEFELEMMRDRRDNVVVVCSIENLDPLGVHTGDSITVAPALTLTDREYQQMRDAAIAIMRAVGVDTGGANIQFAVNPRNGRMVAIEMNPRVSRSSALASKATGFPIAKLATRLALGYTLDELRNDITGVTSACFEPAIDYCVVKMPRFAFEKFPEADETLTTSMKSVGEAMAIGRTFKEAFQKCIRSMEIKRPGYGLHPGDKWLDARQQDAFDDEASVWIDSFGRQSPRPAPAFGGVALGEAPADTRETASRQWPILEAMLTAKIGTPCQGRLYYIRYALKVGWSVERIHQLSHIDPWFLDQLADLVAFEDRLLEAPVGTGSLRLTPALIELFQEAKAAGYSDTQLRHIWRMDAAGFARLKAQSDRPKFKLVDTCAAEFEARTPYYYATHEQPLGHVIRSPEAVAELRLHQQSQGREALGSALRALPVAAPYRYRVLDGEHVLVECHDDELRVSARPKVVILGGGPNRIGQGLEFDYCCVHAAQAAGALGFETVMVNSNPETVSTDYDISDLLFFEPLTHEDVLNICERLNGRPFADPPEGTLAGGCAGLVKGVIVQFGGQTPLNLAQGLHEAGVPILGTAPANIHTAEDRERFQRVVQELGLRQPANGVAFSRAQAAEVAEKLGYPVLVRPSYVLGGRGMRVCNNPADLERYIDGALFATDCELNIDRQHPILIEKFLLDAVEVDVDAISDYGDPNRDPAGGRCDICGIMEHIEEAGIHSGDSCCALPPYSLSPALVDEIKYQVKVLARRLNVCGLMNVQFAIQGRVVHLIEVNPRASRTIPFVSKATGVPWAKLATKVMLGQSLDEALAGHAHAPAPRHVAVKVPVFPFKKLRSIDFVLGPEMRSTGEVMGIDAHYPMAFAKALRAAGIQLPTRGRVLVSVCDADKPRVVSIARELCELGFEVFSTLKTRDVLIEHGIPATLVSKHDGRGAPFLLDMIRARQLDLLINTPIHTGSATEEGRWRVASIQLGIPLLTTLAGARAAVGAIRALRGARGGRGPARLLVPGRTRMSPPPRIAKLALEDGTVFTGTAVGASGTRAGEVVFNTAMTGYQEVFTDPSYCGQIVAMTFPLLGNYGVNPDDCESAQPHLSGVVLKELPRRPSNHRATRSLPEFLAQHGIVGLAGVDTRAVTRCIRIQGALRGVLSSEILDELELVRLARAVTPMSGTNLVTRVTSRDVRSWPQPSRALDCREAPAAAPVRCHIVVLDCGIKHSILRRLVEQECRLTIVPATASAGEIRDLAPDGLLVGNGPGDPAAVTQTIATLRELLGTLPIFGICLGHQLLALALGAATYKLSFGHHGANVPVLNRPAGRVEITSQNHGFAVDLASLERVGGTATHVNLNDGSLEGFAHADRSIAAVQFHPEASPGPHDASHVLATFVKTIASGRPLNADVFV